MITVFDTETTIFQKGNPFAERNRLCYVGLYRPGRPVRVGPPDVFLDERATFDDSSELVGFNPRFDLHHLRRAFGWRPSKMSRIWDCQLAHFLLTAQRTVYPSLEEVRDYYGISRKSVKRSPEYWGRGIDTPDIPRHTILEDLENDVIDTYNVYCRQLEDFRHSPTLYNLFRLHCDDIFVLLDIEWNGLQLNVTKSLEVAHALKGRLTDIELQLRSNWNGIPINFDSPDHISAALYGGTIKEVRKEIEGLYKTGLKTGQPRYRNREIVHILERKCEPLKGSELQKEGFWSTDESILRQLSGAKEIRTLLIERSKLAKELDYLQGLPELINEMDWSNNTLHSSFNQCVAATGRQSSSRPNIQNLTDTVLQLVESRYD